MRRLVLPLLFVLAASPVLAQGEFPFQTRFAVERLNGETPAPRPTLTVRLDPKINAYRAWGFAGCNNWFSRPTLRTDGRFAINAIGGTRKHCQDTMKLEMSYFAALKAATRWRMDGDTLVLEGGSSSMRLQPITQR